jgi:hypothetical protein
MVSTNFIHALFHYDRIPSQPASITSTTEYVRLRTPVLSPHYTAPAAAVAAATILLACAASMRAACVASSRAAAASSLLLPTMRKASRAMVTGTRGRVGSRTWGFVWDRACEICAHASLARHPVATDLTHSLPISLTLFAPTPSFPTLPSHADIHQGRRQNLHSQCHAIRHYRDPETEGKLRCGVRGAGEREMTAH